MVGWALLVGAKEVLCDASFEILAELTTSMEPAQKT